LFSLEQRRLRGDLIEVDKILTGVDKVDKVQLFPVGDGVRTRGTQISAFGERDAGGGM